MINDTQYGPRLGHLRRRRVVKRLWWQSATISARCFLLRLHQLIQLQPLHSELVVGVFPYSLMVSGQIVLSPDEVCHLHGILFVFVGDFLPLVEIIFELSPNEVGIIARVNTKPKLRVT